MLHEEFTDSIRPHPTGSLKLQTNPLDELDTLNHYCCAGRRDFVRDFSVVTINSHAAGDETIFLAVQLSGTESTILHHDSSPAALEAVRRRAKQLGVADRIRFVGGPLTTFVSSVLGNPAFQREPEFGPFDYVRCTSGLNDQDDFERGFSLLLRLLKEDGVLGISCFGYYGREPYRQMQRLGESLNGDRPGIREEVDRLKEIFPFTPERNWTRLAFDNLDPAIRSMRDDAVVTEFLRKDRFAFKVPQLYELLDRHGLRLSQYSRQTRMLYEPWFARADRELIEMLERLPTRDREAVSEIAWNTIERHQFWAVRESAFHVDPGDTDNVPFFNPLTTASKNWRKAFLDAGPDVSPELLVELTPLEKYHVPIPWGKIPYRMVELIDGYKTLGEIFMLIREEQHGEMGLEEISTKCIRFLLAVEREDMILLRHKTLSPLPFTARRLAG